MKKITNDQYLQLLGLLTLAAGHNAALEDISIAASKITGDEPSCGFTDEAVFGVGGRHRGGPLSQTADLLAKLDIAVGDEKGGDDAE